MGLQENYQLFVKRGYAVTANAQTVYGSEAGVPFLANVAGRTVSATFALERALEPAEKGEIKAKLSLACFKASFIARGRVAFSFRAEKGRVAESAIERLAAFCTAAQEAGVPFNVTCPYCGKADTDAYMLCPDMPGYPAGYRSVHQSCVASAGDNLEKTIAERGGSYVSGIIGAFLGAVIGALPTIFTIWKTQTIYSAICALIALGAFFGYKLFGGKMNAASLVITGIFSLLGAFVIQAGLDIVDSIANYQYTFGEAVTLMFEYLPVDAEYRAYFFSGFGNILLFVALGYVFSFFIIKKNTDKGKVQEYIAYRGTLTLKPGTKLIDAFADPAFEGEQADKNS